jgi:protein tyrosine kinase modulator
VLPADSLGSWDSCELTMRSIRPRTPFELLHLLWRRKLLIVVIASPIFISALSVIRHIPSVYESAALVILAPQYEASNAELGLVRAVSYELRSRTNLQAIIRRQALYSWITNPRDAEEMIERDLKVETRPRPDAPQVPESFRLTFQYRNAAAAQEVMRSLVTIFEAANAKALENATTEAAAINARIAELERELAAQRSPANGQGDLTPDGAKQAPLRDQTPAAQAVRAALEDRRYMLEQQIEEQKRLIAIQQPLAEQAATALAAKPDTALGILLARQAALDAEIKQYTAIYTEQNPKLVGDRLEAQLLAGQIEALRERPASILPQEKRELDALEHGLVQLQVDLSLARRQIEREDSAPPRAAAPSAGESSDPVARAAADAQFDPLRTRYDELLERRERNRAVISGHGPAFFQILDLPSRPMAPIGPNRSVLALLALLSALAAAVMVTAIVECSRLSRIRDAKDVEYFLAAPIFASIPETLTFEQTRRRQKFRLLRVVGVLALCGGSIPVLIAIWTRAGVLQRLADRVG